MQLRTVFDPCIHKDLEEYIYQIDCCIPVTKCLIVLFQWSFLIWQGSCDWGYYWEKLTELNIICHYVFHFFGTLRVYDWSYDGHHHPWIFYSFDSDINPQSSFGRYYCFWITILMSEGSFRDFLTGASYCFQVRVAALTFTMEQENIEKHPSGSLVFSYFFLPPLYKNSTMYS